jgi:type IV pilus assembly protein PilY1
MKGRTSRWTAVAAGAAWVLLSGLPALADDTEIFTNLESAAGAKPNVLFIIDTSGSMTEDVTVDKLPYNPATPYPDQGCGATRVYYRSGTGSPPDCDSSSWFSATVNHCMAASTALSGIAGAWTGKAAQYSTSSDQWRTLSSNSRDVECEADAGVHGANGAPTPAVWPRNNDTSRWTNVAGQAAPWGAQRTYTFYSANWLNWYWQGGGGATLQMSRLEVVQSVSTMLASSIDGVNLGLMRFSSNGTGSNDAAAEGGMVTHEVAAIETARASIVSRLNSYNADGWTPLSETMYEAGQYLMGRAVDYGVNSQIRPGTPFPSVAASRLPSNTSVYDSPIDYKCQKNVVILLTDGEPTQDNSADSKITGLPGYTGATGDAGRTCGETGWGRCLDEMAGYLFNSDLSPLEGQQNASTYVVGFGDDVAGSPRLDRVAAAGGTSTAYEARNVTDLMIALQDIFRDLLERNTTFVTPSVTVNAFNRAQTLDDLFVSVFKPSDTLRWPGNLKKYRLVDGTIRDANGAVAVGSDGFFAPGTQSFWSSTPDEHLVDVGGARSRLPLPAARQVYTHIASAGQQRLAHASNALTLANTTYITDALLGTGAPGPTRDDVINWARGHDVRDEDGDGDVAEIARRMGDPLHGRPAVVTYAQTGRDPNLLEKDTVVFLPTNDGFLHAIGGWSDIAAGGGRELWAFAPEELLPRLKDLYANPPTLTRTYGLDGDVRVLKFDRNLNGVVEAGDRVILFFGMRRGGAFYYALDVTDRTEPQLIWKIGPGTGPNDLPGVGETWSPPTLTRVNVPGASQNTQRFVLIFGGGYDEIQENYTYSTDTVGNRIYMVDAETGTRLWYAGGPGAVGTPDLVLPTMTNSITGRINVIDVNGDSFADRMYAADLGGRIWRFDIFNGRTPAPFVTGGVFARLGAGDIAGATIADTRRFYYGPDVSLVQRRGEDPYYAVAIGSGYRGHPLHKATNDYFFVLRDKDPFQKLTQADYDTRVPLEIGSLVDLTGNVMTASVTAASNGWRIAMQADGPLTGEKVLAESTTLNNVVLFPSYQPSPPDDDAADPCHPQSKNRVYAMRIDNGRPAVNFRDDDPDENDMDDADDAINEDDLFTELGQKDGIVGELSVGLLRQTGRTVCVAGVEVLSRCVGAGGTVRTFWQRRSD